MPLLLSNEANRFSTVSCPTIDELTGAIRILNHKNTDDLLDVSEQVLLISGG